MKCILCQSLSIRLICPSCDKKITLSPKKRKTFDDFVVYSFFNYQDIEYLLRSKYSLIGSRIYKILARKAFLYFIDEVGSTFDSLNIFSIGIDDRVKKYYSHCGVIIKEFDSIFYPLFGVLVSNNDICYAGKTLAYRESNKKDFIYTGKRNIDVVLFDDIITTGLSIKEAREVLQKNGVNVLFALTLSDARNI
ncbi:ComF family protein [Helicobacter sp. MIT 99-5507]|uniref:ComF family protein n=1 Tax=Helicobacter sp. MIT 99-5507 TaxID=152489 RepID=UPI000E1ED7FB|nr:ComF family protein [Helicobacter sp. MIT 99-5507]RDU57487.1 hypothetical protein CQA42_06090 [Helicobacter sp. MIT 99-5507]